MMKGYRCSGRSFCIPLAWRRVSRWLNVPLVRAFQFGLPALIISSQADAQGSGVKVSPCHFDQIFLHDGPPPAAFTFGYEHDLGGYLGIALECAFLYRDILHEPPSTRNDRSEVLRYAGAQASYKSNDHAWSLIYRAAYFPNGNNTPFYIGSYIGVRRSTYYTEIVEQMNAYGSSIMNGPFKDRYESSRTVVPFGIRLGLRGPLDGGFWDLYVGIGYQFNGGGYMNEQPELADSPVQVAAFTYTAGIAYGVGW